MNRSSVQDLIILKHFGPGNEALADVSPYRSRASPLKSASRGRAGGNTTSSPGPSVDALDGPGDDRSGHVLRRDIGDGLLTERPGPAVGAGALALGSGRRSYILPTTWASTCDIWSWGLNSTILTASSTTMVWPEGQ